MDNAYITFIRHDSPNFVSSAHLEQTKFFEGLPFEEGTDYMYCSNLQYRHLIPAPVDRTSASTWLNK